MSIRSSAAAMPLVLPEPGALVTRVRSTGYNGPMADDRGRDDYHDPTAGWGGASPARSALTLRLVLAIFGFVVCVAGAVALSWAEAGTFWVVLLGGLAVIALVDISVILWRKARGEPG